MASLTDFKAIVRYEIPWGEMDALGHVNNAVYFRYFETARMKYFTDAALFKVLTANNPNIGPILAHTSCKFIQPLIYPDTINVGVRIMNLGHTSFTMQHIIISDKLGLVATGEAVVVIYDYMLKEKVQLTPSFIDALETFEGRLLR